VVWNVGQGQWTTLRSEKYCDHFDFGGEFKISTIVLRYCTNRTHRLHLSHWDQDHMSYLKDLLKSKVKLCHGNTPLGKPSERKLQYWNQVETCSEKFYHDIYLGNPSIKATTNQQSQVVSVHNILIPGDSTKKDEKIWGIQTAEVLSKISGLVLGHHGSRTSTSDILIANLPHLRWVIASARKARFGHPHAETLLRLQKNKTPILLTEEWGSIEFRL
jgi:competence protein ComEC